MIMNRYIKNMGGKGKIAGSLVGLLLIIMVIAGLSGCAKKNTMGPLQGFWQVMSIERPGEEIITPDSPRLYYRFNLGVLQLSGTEESSGVDIPQFVAEVCGEDPDYTFNFPYVKSTADRALIAEWGIDENPVAVHIEGIKGGIMTMKIGENILTLRKF